MGYGNVWHQKCVLALLPGSGIDTHRHRCTVGSCSLPLTTWKGNLVCRRSPGVSCGCSQTGTLLVLPGLLQSFV